MRLPRERFRAAAVLGAASGARCFAGPAALALNGRPRAGWARAALLLVAAGEAVGDKLPMAGPRSDLAPLAGRVGSGLASGAALGGRRGAAGGASLARASAYPSERARAFAGGRLGLPDPACALVEDAIVYGSSALAAAHAEDGDDRLPIRPPGQSPGPPPLRAVAAGLAAALVGAGALASTRNAYRRAAGIEAGGDARTVLLEALQATAWGAPFGLLARRRPGPLAGLALGATSWGASLAQGPALGTAPPPWKRPAADLGLELGFSLVYGFATGSAFEALSA
jgi:hypothetical protein